MSAKLVNLKINEIGREVRLFYNKTPFPDYDLQRFNTKEDLRLAAYPFAKILSVNEIAETGNKLPKDLQGKDLDDQEVIERYKRAIDYVFEQLPNAEIDAFLERFNLLARHYESDIGRLHKFC